MLKKCILGAVLVCLSALTWVHAQANDADESSSTAWYDSRALSDSDRPYLFYPDANKPKKQANEAPQTGEQAVQAMEALQQSVKMARALALMNPTQDNLKDYIAKQEAMMDRAAKFTDVWRRTIWQNPELDYSQTHRPSDNLAIKAYDNDKDARTKEIMANIAQTQGLLFFIRGDCTYCHTFAPILKQFQDTYGLSVMVVTLDGGTIEGFEQETVPDNGISQALGVTVTPTLFLADTRNRRYLPIGSGVMSITELETRFIALLKEPGTSF
ncbi:conjugal transfer protein TraF [Hydromonas duriensis]|uniref:Conjugal transfer pilus assembly protein TraF n=1 Tax=Hydromonas duriensis TaxID=1527608 RepID=A0A4R6Y6Z2_9BURK|nr:conjugal transfer protein TraF [Hydromonas duriensis]TDR30298.1 conjugal transfer pilus assembly protein TraF [Hydromonas duriensis]